MHLLPYLLLPLLFLFSPQTLAAQICASSGNTNEVPYGDLAKALMHSCSMLQNAHTPGQGFSADSGGWHGNFTGCAQPFACTDLLGKSGGNGGDYKSLVHSCKSTPPKANSNFPYLLTASSDGKFHGGTFQHVINGNTACGVLEIYPGSDDS